MLASALWLSLSMFAAPPETAATPETEAEAAPAQGEGAVEGVEPSQEEALPQWLAEADPELVARVEAMDEAAIDALMAKRMAGISLTPDEEAVFQLIQQGIEAAFDQEVEYRNGDISLPEGKATLHLGEEFRFLDAKDARYLLVEAWGNPPANANGLLGMVLPKDIHPMDPDYGWAAMVTYTQEGHVEDDDAEDIDYDELLEQMQEGTEANNAERTAAGYPALHLQGWAEPPHYDQSKHSLYWAKNLQVEGATENTLNYAIRVLGRKGVLEINAIAIMPQLESIKPAMEEVYGRVEFNTGHKYGDFNPDIDQVAAYGIGGLIAGKMAMKAGLFAVILKALIAMKKFVILGVVGLIAIFKNFFGRKEEQE